jgi:DNA-binding HxlR family transcriptional regulator
MSSRSYRDRCGVARALDVVGERWALLVVRELLLGPKRFTDLRAGLPHVTPDVLAQRLRELEAAELVRRDALPPPAASRVYALTPAGLELEAAVLALGRWGSRRAFPDGEAVFGADSAVLGLKTLFDAEAAADLDAEIELRLGAQRYAARVEGGDFAVFRGEADAPDAAIETDPGTLAGVLWHGTALTSALGSGELRLSGERQVAERFLALFPLPAGASGTAAG